MQNRFKLCHVFHHVRAYPHLDPTRRYKSMLPARARSVQNNATEEARRTVRYHHGLGIGSARRKSEGYRMTYTFTTKF